MDERIVHGAASSTRAGKRWGRRLGILAGVLALIAVGANYGRQVFVLGRPILTILPRMERRYNQHHYKSALELLASIEPDIAGLAHKLSWVSSMDRFPLAGRYAQELTGALTDASKIGSAAVAWHQALGRHRRVLTFHLLQRLKEPAWIQTAQAVQAIYHFPSFPGERTSLATAIMREKKALAPANGLANLIIRNREGFKKVFGLHHTVRFLLLFQDSGELRSTGGFLADYGYLVWKNGRVSLSLEPSISSLGEKMHYHIPAPWVLRTYFGAKGVSFINANVNPNVPTTARIIERMYGTVPGHAPINGVIFVDSWMADTMLKFFGPVRANGVTYTASNLNLRMEFMAEHGGLPNSLRMSFLNDIANVLFRRVAKTRHIIGFLSTVHRALEQKHLIIFANNHSLEKWVEANHWGGNIPSMRDRNSLLVVNNNYGGLKDNYFLSTGITVTIQHESPRKYLEVVQTTWTLNGVTNGWLVGTYRGWVQICVPEGTQLVSLSGSHFYGVRETQCPGIARVAYGTGIQIPARANTHSKPSRLTLTWVLSLPRLSDPLRLTEIMQPGLAQQTFSYRTGTGLKTIIQRQNVTAKVALSN